MNALHRSQPDAWLHNRVFGYATSSWLCIHVEHYIYRKPEARRSFLQSGSIEAFQGDLSPLFTKPVIETCVVPVLMYGNENWVLTDIIIRENSVFLWES